MKQTNKKENLFQVLDSKQALHSHSPFLINIQQFKIKMYPKTARESREFINSSVFQFTSLWFCMSWNREGVASAAAQGRGNPDLPLPCPAREEHGGFGIVRERRTRRLHRAHSTCPVQSERERCHWRELPELQSPARLLKTGTDLHGDPVCAAVPTARVPAPFIAW